MTTARRMNIGHKSGWSLAVGLALLAVAVNFAHAQRQMEPLGRGVVALHSATSQAYVGWRLLATDPTDVGFNVYRSANGGAAVKLNALPLTNTTDYLDTTANFTVSNSWHVRPVTNGVEWPPSGASSLAANSPVRQYLNLPLQPPLTNYSATFPPYDVKFCWVGDFDGDGEYDYLVDRWPNSGAGAQFLQAYQRDGTLLWEMCLGPLSTNRSNTYEPDAAAISVGDKDNVTVYDLDGDGKSEVVVRTANGVTNYNAAGTILFTVTAGNDTNQYLSIVDGLTGAERARALIPNLYFSDGPLNCHAGIIYWDGVHPSILLDGENRVGGGAFQRQSVTWDFRDGQLTQRWVRGEVPGENQSEGHQLRIADANHDGKDDLVQIASVVTDNGTSGVLVYDTELVHGDRYHISDLDPERPGLEMYAIQQNNATLLATSLQDMQSGTLFKKWYSGGVADVGRGLTLDMNPAYRGSELYSTQPGIFDVKGNKVADRKPWPWEAIWWDTGVTRLLFAARDGDGLRPAIYRWNLVSETNDVLYNVQTEGVHSAFGARPAFFGDILGDWREEFIVVADDYSAVRIYTTKIPATNRIYCLMQNPMYRVQCTYKGYYQASYLDYYLGNDMPAVPIPPVSHAHLVWKGGGANVWDESSTANWLTNNLWISNTITVPFVSGQTVLFDISGSNNTAITLTGSLAPGDVRVWSPKNYTFAGPGELSGAMALTKAGAGKLIFSGTNTYSGRTLIGEGSLVVNGSLPNSPVTVRGGVWHDGRLGGTGVVGSAVRIEECGGVSPGPGTNSHGTLTISNNLTLAGRTLSDFDLSSNPGGPTNDLLVVAGNLTLSGTNTLVIRKLNGTLPPGSVYPLINYSGTLTGSLANLTVSGLTGIPYTLTNPPGQIALVIKNHRAPATINWTGGAGGNLWDLLNTTNWLNGAAKDQFAPGDTVRFDSVGVSNLTVNLVGDLNCAGVVVDSTANYTLAGSGAIIGNASLVKSNTGTLTINALNNAFTGRTTLAGGTLVVSELDAAGAPSPLGSAGSSPTNFIMSGNPTLRITGESYTDRGMTLNAGTNTLEIFNAADQLTTAGTIVGVGLLQKSGPGSLALTTSNSYSGGTIISAGEVSLGGVTANQRALGTGLVTLAGGSLRMYDDDGSWETCAWNLNVPAGAVTTIYGDRRCTLTGSLIGSGTLNFYIPYVRTEFNGNWAGFTGVINFTTDGDGGHFRILNSAGYSNAVVNLASGIYAYHLSGTAVSIGALSGGAGSTLNGTPWTVGAKNTNTTFAGSITGSSSITKVGSGTWTLTGSNYYTGVTTVNAGTLLINGNSAGASSTLIVNSGATLGGTGIIGSATGIQGGGRLSPGNNTIGTLTFTNSFSSIGTVFIEINKAAGTNDLVDVWNNLTYGGTLQVTNLSGVLTNGDSFKIFQAPAYANAFTAYSLPALNAGLAWDTSGLTTNGIISVIVTNTAPTGPEPLVWKGDGVANIWDVNLTANWLDTNSTVTSFTNGDFVTFNDAGSNNTPVLFLSSVQPASLRVNATKDYIFSGAGVLTGTNELIKSGSGTLTLANSNAFTGGVTISNGTVRVATSSLGLAHRWSFNNSLADPVGGLTAAIVDVGANNATLTASNVTLTGGVKSSSDYVDLGDDVLPGGSTPATIELWATPVSIQNWSRIFDLGSGTAENLMMSWTVGTTLASDRVEWVEPGVTNTVNNSNQPYSLGVEFHIVMVIEPGAGVGGTTRVSWYRAPATNALLGALRGTFDTTNTLAGLTDTNCWLGRSQWGDNTANASYNEVRIWNRALATNELQSLHAAGPNAVLETLSLGIAPVSLAANTTMNLAGGTAVLENSSGAALSLGALTGVAGSEARMTSGGLNLGGNGASTTFAGSFSGAGSLNKSGAGTLTLSGNSTHTGPTTVNAGRLQMDGNHSAASGTLTIAAGATLGGSGTIGGAAIIQSGATLAPGAGIGTLTFNSPLTLNGTTFMEISRAPLTNDLVTQSGVLTYNGTLVVSNLAGTLVAGDKFKLFNAASYSGSFASNNFPPLAPGLIWNTTKLGASGTLWVVTTNPPTLSPPTSGGGNFSFGGVGGTPGWDYYVLAATNLTLPLAAWERIATNQFDAAGNCVVSIPVVPLQPSRFYRLQVP